jgi:hypothetical protein
MPAHFALAEPALATSPADIDRAIAELVEAKGRWRRTSLAERIDLARRCIAGVYRSSAAWTDVSCQAKGIAPDSPTSGEELAAGPLAVLRYLRLLVRSLEEIERFGRPRLPGKLICDAAGRLHAPLFPARGLFDGLLFRGYRAEAWLPREVTRENFADYQAGRFRASLDSEGVALVLGAGNVSSIPAVDALAKLFQDNRVVLLKFNSVNAYLAEIFRLAFAPLIEGGWLRLVQGGAETGSHAAHHASVDEIHVTGSLAAHDTIVWGPPGAERDERRRLGRPLLTKPITSELGNVTPWVVLPGNYSERQLDFQAENVAAMIVNNASFNCIAVKLIVTWRQWPQRRHFLDKIDAVLARVPRRLAYYPGAADRYRRFTGNAPSDEPPHALPWTLRRDVDRQREPHWFDEESFVCACAETALMADSPADFAARAAEFVNAQVWGTLGVGLMAPDSPESRRPLDDAIARLRYGTVAVNAWPALSYAMMCVPWGGYPSGTLADPGSGLGWVHNTYFLDGVEKTVLRAPLVVWPKPLWFPTHRRADALARQVVNLYHCPAWWKLAGIIRPALGF